jgi:hypothetical protein
MKLHAMKGKTSVRRSACSCSTAALIATLQLTVAHSATYDVHVQPEKFTLYTDPYNGNLIKVGGFSGLYPAPGKHNSFYVVSDRGPAPDFVDAAGKAFKTWLVPTFGPHLMTVRLLPSGYARIDEIIPLTRPDGAPITGLPTTKPATDVPYDANLNVLPFDEDSLDVEGITIDPWGNFWVCEEYKPSVAMVAPNGQVQLRLVPAGTLTGLERVPTYDVLPAVLTKRRNNRGFEGIAASADGTLYAAVQRPLNNPSRAVADASQNVRLVAINLNCVLNNSPEVLVRQFLYRIEAPVNNITLSDLFSTGPTTLLVPERGTDKLFEVDLTDATDITPFEDAAGRLLSDPTLTIERLNAAGLSALGITTVSKRIILNSMMAIDPLLEKIEGVCVVGDTIVLTHDNDFNVAEASSIPAVPNPDGPLVQLELIGNNLSKIFTVPIPHL